MPRKPTDLKAVIESRQRLDAIAQAHPELLNTHGASVDAWVDALKKDENDMSKVTAERQADYRKRQSEQGNVQTVLWLPAETLQAIHALKDKYGGSREGVVVAAVEKLA